MMSSGMSSGLVRCAVVHSPAWPLIASVLHGRHGRGPEIDITAPMAVLRAQRIAVCSPLAWHHGVRPGQRRRQAQGACPHLVMVPHDPERDMRWFEPVARSIGELVPLLDLETPGSVLLATRGPARYVGGEAALAVRLGELAAHGVTRIRDTTGHNTTGHSTRKHSTRKHMDPEEMDQVGGRFGVGIADGRLASTLAARTSARRGEPVIIETGESATADFLAPHPVRVLTTVAGCPPDLVDLLERLGLRSLGDVAALSREHLFDRFAAMGVAIHRLAAGTDDTAPCVVAPPEDLSIVQMFDDALGSLEPLLFAAKRLVDELSALLQDRAMVCTRLVVEVETDHAESSHRAWYRAEGLDASSMLDRIRWQLDGWIHGSHPPTAGIVLMRLTPTQVRSETGVQEGFWGGRSQADETAARAVTRVIGLLGSDSVTMAIHRGGRDPREVYELVPFVDLESRSLSGQAPIGSHARVRLASPDPQQEHPPWPGSIPLPAPGVVLPDPEPIRVLDADEGIVAVDGRGLVSADPNVLIRGMTSYRISAWAGPWPVDEKWWEARARRSARFQLVVDGPDGPRAYLAEVTAGTWWLTAEYS